MNTPTIDRETASHLGWLLRAYGIPWPWLFKRFGVVRAGQLSVGQVANIFDEIKELRAECVRDGVATKPPWWEM